MPLTTPTGRAEHLVVGLNSPTAWKDVRSYPGQELMYSRGVAVLPRGDDGDLGSITDLRSPAQILSRGFQQVSAWSRSVSIASISETFEEATPTGVYLCAWTGFSSSEDDEEEDASSGAFTELRAALLPCPGAFTAIGDLTMCSSPRPTPVGGAAIQCSAGSCQCPEEARQPEGLPLSSYYLDQVYDVEDEYGFNDLRGFNGSAPAKVFEQCTATSTTWGMLELEGRRTVEASSRGGGVWSFVTLEVPTDAHELRVFVDADMNAHAIEEDAGPPLALYLSRGRLPSEFDADYEDDGYRTLEQWADYGEGPRGPGAYGGEELGGKDWDFEYDSAVVGHSAHTLELLVLKDGSEDEHRRYAYEYQTETDEELPRTARELGGATWVVALEDRRPNLPAQSEPLPYSLTVVVSGCGRDCGQFGECVVTPDGDVCRCDAEHSGDECDVRAVQLSVGTAYRIIALGPVVFTVGEDQLPHGLEYLVYNVELEFVSEAGRALDPEEFTAAIDVGTHRGASERDHDLIKNVPAGGGVVGLRLPEYLVSKGEEVRFTVRQESFRRTLMLWRVTSRAFIRCPGRRHACSGHGTCSEDGECVCREGYAGDDCSYKLQSWELRGSGLEGWPLAGALIGMLLLGAALAAAVCACCVLGCQRRGPTVRKGADEETVRVFDNATIDSAAPVEVDVHAVRLEAFEISQDGAAAS